MWPSVPYVRVLYFKVYDVEVESEHATHFDFIPLRTHMTVYIDVESMARTVETAISLLCTVDRMEHSKGVLMENTPSSPTFNRLLSTQRCAKLASRFDALHEVMLEGSLKKGHAEMCSFLTQEAYYRRHGDWRGPPLVQHPRTIKTW